MHNNDVNDTNHALTGTGCMRLVLMRLCPWAPLPHHWLHCWAPTTAAQRSLLLGRCQQATPGALQPWRWWQRWAQLVLLLEHSGR